MADAAISNRTFFSAIVAALFHSLFSLFKAIYNLTSLSIFYLFTILPLLLSSAFTTAVATVIFTWLATFKLLLFPFQKNPLHPPKSLISFITFTSLRLKIDSDSKNKNSSPLNLWVKSLILPILIDFVNSHKQKLNPLVLLILYCVLPFIQIDLLVLKVTKSSLYLHVKSVFPGKNWATVAVVMATVVVAGVKHEQVFDYVTHVSPTWEMTSFFILHGVFLVVEFRVKKALAEICELPPVVVRLLTMGFMGVTSLWLLFLLLIQSGGDVKVLKDYKLVADYLKTMLEI